MFDNYSRNEPVERVEEELTLLVSAVPFVLIGFIVVLFLRETALRQRPTAQAYDGAVTDVAYRNDDPAPSERST